MEAGDWTRLGPTVRPGGVDFAVFAPAASRIDLCVFTPDGASEVGRATLPTRSHGVHAGFLPGAGPGTVYGLRAHGAWAPQRGRLFDPDRVLFDPYAPRMVGEVRWTPDGARPPLGAVIDHAFDWGDERPLRTRWSDTVIYEAHVKGLTATHAEVPPPLRGTYLGLAHPAVLAHLRELGVTAIELLPIQASVTERRLRELGLTNYWGYGTLGFFAPDPRFASVPGAEVTECKAMIRALHAAGIEVLLDVVYNHTIEADPSHPALSLRGLANTEHYRLSAHDPRQALDWSGCGNTLDLSRSPALRLVLDSMRCWVREYHVDGFRFDLAPSLFRGPSGEFDPHGRFAAALEQDPTLAGVKLIAEPWDLGPHGYRLGEFPRPMREWNDRFRDTARRFWRGDGGQLAELAQRIGGSQDTFGAGHGVHPEPRGPLASINYVTCHDGFTLADLVSYERKRNHANGEDGRDGSDQNWSCAWGPEGPTDDPRILEVRARVARSLLATAALSLGVPMVSHGDELGRTQQGNNNAYCQDGPLSWIDWASADGALRGFVSHLFAVRARHRVLRRPRFLRPEEASWLHPAGRVMTTEDWLRTDGRVVGLALADPDGAPLLLVVNGGPEPASFLVHDLEGASLVVDSSRPELRAEAIEGPVLTVPAHAFLALETGSSSTRTRPIR
jgi:isoamylase